MALNFFRPLAPRLTITALALFLSAPLLAQPEPTCPAGVLKCAPQPETWARCKPNDLLEFYVPGLPTSGDRTVAPTDFRAVSVDTADTSRYVLEGDVEMQRLDQLLRGDTLSYDNESTAWQMDGNVRYQDRGALLSADHGHGTTEPQTSTLDNVRYQLLDRRGNGRASRASMGADRIMELSDPSYTTCPPDNPHWLFQAQQMTLDQDSDTGTGRNVTFRIKDVPVLWLPWVSFPLSDARKSGFLLPSLSYSDVRGLDVTTPYYLNLAPNYDVTLYPRLMTERGLMLGAQARYLTRSSSGSVDVNWLPDDRVTDSRRSSLNLVNRTRLGEHWGVVADVRHVSDDRYFEDFGRSLDVAATRLLPSRIYLQGRGQGWSASVGGDRYQVTDPDLSRRSEPYRRLPRATFNANHLLTGGLELGVDAEAVAFSKREALDGQRIDLQPWLAWPIERAGWFVRPKLAYRQTTYHLDRDADSSPSRGLPIYSFDSGLQFEREFSRGQRRFIQTLEPRAYYVYAPYRDQSELPVFDTEEVPFSFGQLFRSNRFVGADRQMDANNLTVALTSRLFDAADGSEYISASIGQIRYFSEQRVQMPNRPQTDWSGSTWIGELDMHLGPRWRVTAGQHWNPNTDRSDLTALGVQHRFGERGTLNLTYRFRRDFMEQVDLAGAVPINDTWSIVGRHTRSLLDNKNLESFLGFERDSCCIAVRALARHWVHNFEGDTDNALYFEIEFKGLGAVGQRTEEFLRRAILGYQ